MTDTEANEVRLKVYHWRRELEQDRKRTVDRHIAMQLLELIEYDMQELCCKATAGFPAGGVDD